MIEHEVRMIDIWAPEDVEILVDSCGTSLWVNVNGMCRLRIKRIPMGKLSMPAIEEIDNG